MDPSSTAVGSSLTQQHSYYWAHGITVDTALVGLSHVVMRVVRMRAVCMMLWYM
jgi:hypothetical protein